MEADSPATLTVARASGEAEKTPLAVCVLGLTFSWSLLGVGALLGAPRALTFGACAGCAVALGARFTRLDALHAVRGGAAGIAAFGATLSAIDAACGWVGIETQTLAFERPAAVEALAIILLSPVFEEIVYRGPLLDTLRARTGRVLAVVLTSVAFALPHGAPAPLLGCFLLGLMLASLRLGGLALAASIGVHTGLNAAGLASSEWPELERFVRLPALALGGIALALVLLTRARSAGSGRSVRVLPHECPDAIDGFDRLGNVRTEQLPDVDQALALLEGDVDARVSRALSDTSGVVEQQLPGAHLDEQGRKARVVGVQR